MQQTIALVDDDSHVITLLNDLLGEAGYRTVAVADGASAPAMIAREKPDLVILDLWMEQRDSGWIVYDALRADDATAHIPVLICSADIAAVRARAASLAECGDDAIEKPFDIAELLAPWNACSPTRDGADPYPSPTSGMSVSVVSAGAAVGAHDDLAEDGGVLLASCSCSVVAGGEQGIVVLAGTLPSRWTSAAFSSKPRSAAQSAASRCSDCSESRLSAV